jgi:hypothetical protein
MFNGKLRDECLNGELLPTSYSTGRGPNSEADLLDIPGAKPDLHCHRND